MDYEAIQTRTQKNVDDDSAETLTTLKYYINDTYREIVALGDWEFLKKKYSEDTVASQRAYPLQSDVKRVYRVQMKSASGDEYSDINILSHKKYLDLNDESTTTNELPTYVAKEVDDGTESLVFYPIPAFTAVTNGLRYWYYKRVDDLSANDDTPVFPAEFHEILALGASFRWLDEEDDLRAPRYERLYRNMLARMQSELNLDMGEYQEPIQVVNA